MSRPTSNKQKKIHRQGDVNRTPTSFLKVPLSPLPEHTVSPCRCAAFLTRVIVIREEVIFVGRSKVQLSLNKASENLK